MTPREILSEREKKQLDDKGYLVLEAILSAKEIENMQRELERIARLEGGRAGDVRPNEFRAKLRASSSLKSRLSLWFNHWTFKTLRFLIRKGRERSGLFNDTLYTAFSHPLYFRSSNSFKGDVKQMLVNIVQQQEDRVERICNLHNKSAAFDICFSHPKVLACVQHLIGSDYKLSSLNLRNPRKGSLSQPIHTDWPSAVKPGHSYSCNTLWLLDDVGPSDGPTRVIPGTHTLGRLPSSEMEDLRATLDKEVCISAKKGSVVIINGQLWHGGTAKASDRSRRVVQGFFVHSAHNQQQPQEMLLTAETEARLDQDQLERLGIFKVRDSRR